MAKFCNICGKKLFLTKFIIKDGNLCSDCYLESGLTASLGDQMLANTLTLKEIKERQTALINNPFNATRIVGNIAFDDNSKRIKVNSTIVSYNDLLSYELLEDNESVTKGGVAQAVTGGLLFGGVGAVVGAITGPKKNKNLCSSLKLKLTLNNISTPLIYVDYLNCCVKTDSFLYKTAYSNAQLCLSILEGICHNNDHSSQNDNTQLNSSSAADEILKFKNLLDAGIITIEEFELKKKQLLELN